MEIGSLRVRVVRLLRADDPVALDSDERRQIRRAEYMCLWRARHPQRVREMNRASYIRARDKILAQKRAYRIGRGRVALLARQRAANARYREKLEQCAQQSPCS